MSREDHDLHRAIGVQGRRLDELTDRVRALETTRSVIPEARIEAAAHAAIAEEDSNGTLGELLDGDMEIDEFSGLMREVLGRAIRRGIAMGRGEA